MITIQLELQVRRAVEADLPALEWYGMFTAHRSMIRAAFDRPHDPAARATADQRLVRERS